MKHDLLSYLEGTGSFGLPGGHMKCCLPWRVLRRLLAVGGHMGHCLTLKAHGLLSYLEGTGSLVLP